jgi:hypothetical protein
MFVRLAEQYRSMVGDLVMSLQALAATLRSSGLAATCYVCGDGRDGHGASFVADLGDRHVVRFMVSDFGISWVESRDGHELVKFEGAEAIQALQQVVAVLQMPPASDVKTPATPQAGAAARRSSGRRRIAPVA